MLSEICREIKNWFEQSKYIADDITIENGSIVNDLKLQDGQYFRIVGSVFNDGIYQYPATNLHDETFDGAIWFLAIPQEIIDLSAEVDEWKEKYATIDSVNMSPYNSESFGGYSYSKNGSDVGTWQSVFASRLNAWRKI